MALQCPQRPYRARRPLEVAQTPHDANVNGREAPGPRRPLPVGRG
jgi:hypothetical protein